jgi:hypothetical protein
VEWVVVAARAPVAQATAATGVLKAPLVKCPVELVALGWLDMAVAA